MLLSKLHAPLALLFVAMPLPSMAQAPDTAPEPAATAEPALDHAPELAATEPTDESATPDAPGETDHSAKLDALIAEATEDTPAAAVATPAPALAPTYPFLEHHGYFRFRADLFDNGHLGTYDTATGKGTSGIPIPLTANKINAPDGAGAMGDPDDTTLGGANIRFRYRPTFHVSPTMRIKGSVDFLDNTVLGGTPDYAGYLNRFDVPLAAFVAGAAPPEAGTNGFRDGVRVKEAYAEWQPAFLLRVGRMSSHWGLGILANGGQGIDDDYGDYADRAMIVLKAYGVYVVGAMDFVYEGATTGNPGDLFGQPYDLGNRDDVNQFVVSVFQRPLSPAERRARRVSLRENLGSAFDWGLYTVFRSQEYDLDSRGEENDVNGGWSSEMHNDLLLTQRNATAIIPDLWMRYENRFDYSSGIRVELEAAAIIGEIGNTNTIGLPENKKTIEQIGAALEVAYDTNNVTMGLDAGFASGDTAEGFGIKDRLVFAEEDGDQGNSNPEVTNFKFDRNYHLDLLLFREVIGSVTNAIYAKPYISYDLFDSVEESLGARVDFLWAQAHEAQATPGDKDDYGFEIDLRLFYEEANRFNFDIEAGMFVPGGAFSNLASSPVREAETAYSLQTRITLQF
jgi:uncharacterized protein (TIGR04551 family)